MSGNEKIRAGVVQFFPDKRVITSGIASYMCHHHVYFFNFEMSDLRILQPKRLPVDVAIYGTKRFQGSQACRQCVEPISPACQISSHSEKYSMYLSSHQAWVSERSPILSITISFIPQKYLYLPTEDNNTMENSHKYFKRDISWLSFNYRVLLEAEDETLLSMSVSSSCRSIRPISKSFTK